MLALLHGGQGLLSRPRHPVSLAYGTIRQYSALASGNRSSGQGRSLPECVCQEGNGAVKGNSHIHNIIKHDESSSFCLLFVPYPYLTDATIPSKEVIQVVSRDLVVQILDEQDAVGAWGKFCLALRQVQGERWKEVLHTVGLASAMGNCFELERRLRLAGVGK